MADSVLPPGTLHLVETQTDGIFLVPRPSSSPDDPLNWAPRRKWLNVALVLFYVFSTGIGGTSVYSVLTPISEDTGITIGQLNTGTGFLFLMAGWTNLIWQPLALTFGRRPIILLSLLFCVAVSEWTAWIDRYSPWAAARCLYGFACAPVEVLPEICIPDVFFAHERGTYIGWYMLVLCGSNFVAPLIAGFMNDAYGWHWVQHWAALILALNFVLAFFFYEESMYTREQVEADKIDEVPDPSKVPLNQVRPSDLPVTQKTFLQKMKLWSYSRVSPAQVLRMAYRPILIFFLFPNIMWAGFTYGFALAWYVVFCSTSSVENVLLSDDSQVQRLQRHHFVHSCISSLQLLRSHRRSLVCCSSNRHAVRRCRMRPCRRLVDFKTGAPLQGSPRARTAPVGAADLLHPDACWSSDLGAWRILPAALGSIAIGWHPVRLLQCCWRQLCSCICGRLLQGTSRRDYCFRDTVPQLD